LTRRGPLFSFSPDGSSVVFSPGFLAFPVPRELPKAHYPNNPLAGLPSPFSVHGGGLCSPIFSSQLFSLPAGLVRFFPFMLFHWLFCLTPSSVSHPPMSWFSMLPWVFVLLPFFPTSISPEDHSSTLGPQNNRRGQDE